MYFLFFLMLSTPIPARERLRPGNKLYSFLSVDYLPESVFAG